jgi:hypothetical protein
MSNDSTRKSAAAAAQKLAEARYLRRRKRFRFYRWCALLLLVAGAVWTWNYLRPERWYKFTDQVSFEQIAKDVELGFVLWEPAELVVDGIDEGKDVSQPAISSDGARMVYASMGPEGDSDLFLRLWDGSSWGEARPMRALNSKFQETAPALSGDGKLLFFSSDRPGGRGGVDIWVSRWDGAEYAWSLPLTERVNSPFDEIDPAFAPDGLTLYFASNRPHPAVGISEKDAADAAAAQLLEDVTDRRVDFEIYAAEIATDTPFELLVERHLSMLYSLRKGALAEAGVMAKLGGTPQSEVAVDKALAYLASTQEEDGRWDIAKTGGAGGHDVAATAFALLAFYGRGETHLDPDCQYHDAVKRGLDWLLGQGNAATGDLRGPTPQSNAMYDQGIASLALVEAYGVTKDTELRSRAQAAIDFISESQHEEGGWRYQPNQRGDLSVSGWMIMALASGEMSGIQVPKKTWDGVANFLSIVRGGKDGGSYGYTDSPGKNSSGSRAMNAVGFFCAQLTGASPNSAKAFESALLVEQAGFNLDDIYYAYYGTLAAYQHQGPVWKKWIGEMQPAFLGAQAADGSWAPTGQHGNAMGKVIGTALVSLCLEAHYRYTPLYGLGYQPDPAGPATTALDRDALGATPMFRHARHLAVLSSPADDTAPVLTDHGDFMYFVSARESGFGGTDLYRSRVSGSKPGDPKNLGVEVNSPGNETHPAVRMAGFQLIYNSDRAGDAARLYSANSKRVVRRFDYSKLPPGSWLKANLLLVIALAIVAVLSLWLLRRALRRMPVPKAPEDPEIELPSTEGSVSQ